MVRSHRGFFRDFDTVLFVSMNTLRSMDGRTSHEQLVMDTVSSASSSVPVSCRTMDPAVRWRSMNISPMTVLTVRAHWVGPELYCYVCYSVR